MVRLKVLWTRTAIRQRNHVFEYWNQRNQSNSYSRKLNIKIRERINQLKKLPELGTKTNYKKTRSLSLGHYSILYRIEEEQLIITGFWDNRRDPEELLKFLLKQSEG